MSTNFSHRPYHRDLQKALLENHQPRETSSPQVIYGKPFVEEEPKTSAQRIAAALDRLPVDVTMRHRRLMVPLDGGPAVWML